MTSTWMAAGAIVGAVLMPPSGTAQTPRPAGQPTTQSASAERANPDAEFVARAAEGGKKEVELGRLASERASNPEVKAFGARMVTDHTKSSDELMALVRNEAPQPKSPAKGTPVAKLAGLSGQDFDRAYMTEMVSTNEATLALFEQEARDGKHEALRSWAAQRLTGIREHLQMARTLHAKLITSVAR